MEYTGSAQERMKTREFYDVYSARQLRVGINERHHSIQRWLRQFGLAAGMDVLEVGCGVGTQTELIAQDLAGTGSLTAVDLSPRSVELARERLARWANVTVVAGDILELDLGRTYDLAVLPDVIEHIPQEQHRALFARICPWLKSDGWILVHMPSPFYQEWCREERPELLQIIDQPVFTDALAADIQPSGLYIHFLSTYSIWAREPEYQVLVLKPRPEPPVFHFPEQRIPTLRRVYLALRRRLGVLGPAGRDASASPGSRRAAGEPTP